MTRTVALVSTKSPIPNPLFFPIHSMPSALPERYGTRQANGHRPSSATKPWHSPYVLPSPPYSLLQDNQSLSSPMHQREAYW
ncbi:hypothetical protein PoB_007520500 [Plakobranchus ocellatus]|uniref:Uncharacterized protein n=1 Tax=Plakobranchus ocellatus TaxID=259542 RepID=A0AAV4DX07_9GAST|nr:hypothetical protein PoB_007520500 [Plakobranchus ocellatus]